MYQEVQQGLPDGNFRIVPHIDPEQLFYGCTGLIAEINKIIYFMHLFHQRSGKFPAVLKNGLIFSLKNGCFDTVDALVR